ncbi:L-2-hydroxyglutarate oxidase [Thalassoroseus pseudoceratinae]|uniref:L-2-hydroxyglutarate oxidase n=1 Tax=Thalassoroseus pseudoceratinae TaxID=2713176 RepID=UPI0014210C96|nr:L-2-hydroxyglutarate oxidase [Thalassoroseus pseudoceratinae]
MAIRQADVAIIGGGIVGLSTAYQLTQSDPDLKIVVLEKESRVAAHQTGRNSGVLHSGIYYKPGSLKAKNCRAGKLAMQEFCEREGIAYEICGKVIVAVEDGERAALHRIFERGQANGVRCELVGRERLTELEPHVAGVEAIHVPEAGIVDYSQVTEKFAEYCQRHGGEVLFNARVYAVSQQLTRVVIGTTNGDVEAKMVVNCGGLYSDRILQMSGEKPSAKIIPFRGEYFELKPSASHLCKNLIYPVPDPKFPFLGVHFTRMVHGGVECGPNAVLAFAREGYEKLNFNIRDLTESLTYPGFLRLAARHWKMGLGEMWRSISKRAFVRALQRLMPEITADDLVAAPSGVRAQALQRDGSLVDDFLIRSTDRCVNVLNAPSPAATSSLNIGRLIVDEIRPRLSR